MANCLINESSTYLRQHAEQPVDWYPWGQEALEKARREDKPLFLSIGYSTCHWCHVMAHESFADEEVAALLNKNFIAVKIDREERPDLDQIYMLTCQFFTGAGGWPLSVFITPEGLPFFAGTYFPKQTGAGLNTPGFIEILNYLATRWHSERQALLKNGQEVVKLLHSMEQPRPVDEVLGVDLLGNAAEHLAENFDHENGGFGAAPKFPTPHQLLFLLRWHQRSGSNIALEMVEKTLDKMAAGGIFDHLGGGFHRYAVDKQWQVPHFEKMLYDQATIAYAYTEAYQISGKKHYAEVVASIFNYLERELRGTEGAFYAAQDADSEGIEGAFYVWAAAQIKTVLDQSEAALFCRHYGVSEKGNFPEIEGSSVLRRIAYKADNDGSGDENEKTTTEPAQKLEHSRKALFQARTQRQAPFIDKKIITAWNGLMIAALARASVVFKKPHYLELAETAARTLDKHLSRDGDRLWRRWSAGEESAIPAFLDDYAFYIQGLLELNTAGADTLFLERARRLMATVNELFWDDQGERFFYSSSDSEKLIARNLELHDGALPGSNSVMIMNLLRLMAITGDTEYQKQAEKALGRIAGLAAQTPLLYLQYLSALDEYLP
ncbi:MAG: thioredoxin domain-containing protein [Deltaproteobacteria bacterium]|nr:thioredoxin domain-containing protein [Deltaproteobacteria bacterium]